MDEPLSVSQTDLAIAVDSVPSDIPHAEVTSLDVGLAQSHDGFHSRTRTPPLQLPPATTGTLEPIIAGLTEPQKTAVTHTSGPLLIVAGAGTGKTTVITRRIAWLCTTRLARPDEILALTFTDKAAREMEERVDQLVPYGYNDLHIRTFHSFGYRLLRDHALEAGLDPDLKVLSKQQQIIFLREHLFDLPLDIYRPLGDPTAYLDALTTLIARAKDEDCTDADYLAWAVEEKYRADSSRDAEMYDRARRHDELARTYAAYEALMRKNGCIDFGDQVFRVLQLMRQRPSVLAACQNRYRFILVDEFQDTNHAQFELVRMLCGEHRNLTVVGDDDQAIYRFRGAAIANILRFDDVFPDARQVVLTNNFRSPQPILDAAYRLVGHNNPHRLEVKSCIDKRLIGRDDPKAVPVYRVFDTVSTEADEVARLIDESHAVGAPYGDHAILVRGNRDADPYLRAMNMRGIPFRFTGNQGLYARPEIRLLISFLRTIADFHDSTSLYALAASEVYQLNPMDLTVLCGIGRRRHFSLFDVMRTTVRINVPSCREDKSRQFVPTAEDGALLHALSEEARATIGKIIADVQRYVELSVWRTPGNVLYEFLRGSGALQRLSRLDNAEDDVRLRNIARFFDIVHGFEMLDGKARLSQLVRHLDLLLAAGDNPAVAETDLDLDAVNVLTVHKSKGLEFPIVFIVGSVEGKFPSRAHADRLSLPTELWRQPVPEGDAHVQEERRLFYVAMTRAAQTLYIFGARDRGGRRQAKPSRFVAEALDLAGTMPATSRCSAGQVIERFASEVEVEAPAPSPIPDDQQITLSHKQLDDYMTCPLKYKYVHVLRVPLFANHAVVYGRALHEGVSFYNEGRRKGETPDVVNVLEVFARAWVNEGFLSPEHEEQRFEQGQHVLRAWVERQQQDTRVPFLVEQDFAFSLERTRVIGRFDRVDKWAEGSAIIDYKSTDVRTQADADKRARDNFQLAIYVVAWLEETGRLPDYVELQFLESGQAGRARKTMRDVEEARRIILDAARGLRARDYSARPEARACGVCAFREICPATAS